VNTRWNTPSSVQAAPHGNGPAAFMRRFAQDRHVLYVVSIVGLLAIWAFFGCQRQVFQIHAPSPGMVLNELWRNRSTKTSPARLVGPLLVGASIGSDAGLPSVQSSGFPWASSCPDRYINALVKPVFDLIKPMPPIS